MALPPAANASVYATAPYCAGVAPGQKAPYVSTLLGTYTFAGATSGAAATVVGAVATAALAAAAALLA